MNEVTADPTNEAITSVLRMQPFLSEFARDVLAVIGAVGVAATAVGLWLAWVQMRRTMSATQAASEAAVKALNESRDQYNRSVITQVGRLLAETRAHLKGEGSDLATMQLNDIAELMLQVAGSDSCWRELAQRVQGMEQSFDRAYRKHRALSDSLRTKWHKLEREIQIAIAGSLVPFNDENSDAEQRAIPDHSDKAAAEVKSRKSPLEAGG